MTGEQWRALATEASRLLAEQLMLKGVWDNIKDMDPSQLALSPQMQINIQQDPQVMALNNTVVGLQQQYHCWVGHAGAGTQECRPDRRRRARDEVIQQKENAPAFR